MANPARGLLNRENRTKEKSGRLEELVEDGARELVSRDATNDRVQLLDWTPKFILLGYGGYLDRADPRPNKHQSYQRAPELFSFSS